MTQTSHAADTVSTHGADISAPETTQSTPVPLSVKRGSRFWPILLMVVVAAAFVLYNQPPGLEQIVTTFALPVDLSQPLTFETVLATMLNPELLPSVSAQMQTFGVGEFFAQVAAPLGQAYLTQLVDNFGVITSSLLQTGLALAAYALIPGLAGLIYRRSFWPWFGCAFALLFAIHQLGWVSLTDAEAMPVSGAIMLFLVLQGLLLIFANRLQRISNRPSRMSPLVFNLGLAVVLLAIAVACMFGLGPGQSASQPVSWVWGFLGSGITGFILKWEFILVALPTVFFLFRRSEAWVGDAPKNIVVCFDGTSNTPEQEERGLAAQTNVYKLFDMLKSDKPGTFLPAGKFDANLSKVYGRKQIAHYYAGVGNHLDNDPITQVFGLAGGFGANAVIERAYLDLMRVHRPNDRVFIVGFSRGAAMARLMARAIDERGAPNSIWTVRLFGRHWVIWRSSKRRKVRVDVLGCWDTVGSFGIAKTIAGINFQQIDLFKDLGVPDNVERAYHMVALDERRDSFEPTLMDPDPIRPERIVEVWFPGDHANVGGGWATDRLSDLTLDFLLRHSSSGYAADGKSRPGDEAWGLYLAARNELAQSAGNAPDGPAIAAVSAAANTPTAVDPQSKVNGGASASAAGMPQATERQPVAAVRPDPLGQLRHWHSALYVYRPRKVPLHAVISEAVFARMTRAQPVYAPQSLFDLNEELDTKRDAIDSAVSRLLETQSVSIAEREAIMTYKDSLRLQRWPTYRAAIQAAHNPVSPAAALSNAVMAK